MNTYIAIVSEPAPEVVFVEERRLIVLARSREDAEAAFQAFSRENHPDWGISITDEQPRAGYVKASDLQPNIAEYYRDLAS